MGGWDAEGRRGTQSRCSPALGPQRCLAPGVTILPISSPRERLPCSSHCSVRTPDQGGWVTCPRPHGQELVGSASALWCPVDKTGVWEKDPTGVAHRCAKDETKVGHPQGGVFPGKGSSRAHVLLCLQPTDQKITTQQLGPNQPPCANCYPLSLSVKAQTPLPPLDSQLAIPWWPCQPSSAHQWKADRLSGAPGSSSLFLIKACHG